MTPNYAGWTTGQLRWDSDISWAPTETCVQESEHNVVSGVLGLALQINPLKQDDRLGHLLCFSASQVCSSNTRRPKNWAFNFVIHWKSRFWVSWVCLGTLLWTRSGKALVESNCFVSSCLRDPPSSTDQLTLFLLCARFSLQVHHKLKQKDTESTAITFSFLYIIE